MKFNSDRLKIGLIILGGIVFAYFCGYYIWKFKKSISYSFEYEDRVIQTIRDNVKETCLKE